MEEKVENLEETTEEVKEEESIIETPNEIVVDNSNNDDTPKEPKKKKTKLVLCIVLLLLIAVALVVYYFIFNGEKTTTKVNTNSEVKESDYRLSDNSLSDFDLKFMQLENNNKNMIYSPLSIKYTLAMLRDGTAGDSNKQITNIIGDYKSKKYVNSENMSFANAMFIKDTYKEQVKEEYSKKINEKYNAEVIYDTFQTPDNLNKWVSDKTFSLIKDLFDDSVSDLDFAIVNALAIDMNWNNQIQCAYGQSKVPCKHYSVSYKHEDYSDYVAILGDNYYPDMTFNGKTGIKSVEVGSSINNYDIIKDLGEEKIKKTIGDEYQKALDENPNVADCGTKEEIVNGFYEDLKTNYKQVDVSTDYMMYVDENVKVFAKDLKEYNGTTLQYVGIMPKKENLNEYVKNANAKEINKVINSLKEIKSENFKEGVVTKIKASIPLFKFDYQLKLMNDLKKLGVTDVFNDKKANLSKLTKAQGTYIGSADHKANIEFSNDGIKAAAATQMGGLGAAGCWDYKFKVPVEEIDLTFDKPYMFIIRDKATGEVWFTGTVYEPSTN